ncbi:MAG: polysaccharide deacetylase family protein [Candidatus Schekmanbacteria bacterium]|nr:polysaccharide deacetylase family protein [Candidatus Schekmanbacteria bacterium]
MPFLRSLIRGPYVLFPLYPLFLLGSDTVTQTLIVVIVLQIALMTWGIFSPRSRLLVDVISHGPRVASGGSKPMLALTFDDGPHPTFTGEILDILARHDAKATFFVVGVNAERYPDVMKRIQAEGHTLGNHTMTHPYFLSMTFLYSRRKVRRECAQASATIARISGAKIRFFRPPANFKNHIIGEAALHTDHAVVVSSVISGDTRRGRNAEAIAARVLNRIRPGDIVGLHDGIEPGRWSDPDRRRTVEATKIIIAGAIRRGFALVTLDELLREPEAAMAPTPCLQRL